MKIAINGDIIDTKDIWKIGKLEEPSSYVGFNIHMFNSKKNRVLKELNYNMDTLEKKSIVRKVKSLRNSIIKIWSENQSEIPQFNI